MFLRHVSNTGKRKTSLREFLTQFEYLCTFNQNIYERNDCLNSIIDYELTDTLIITIRTENRSGRKEDIVG